MEEDRKELINGFDELTSYFFIDAIGGFIWRINHDASHGRIDISKEMQDDLNKLSVEQQYCVSQLGRFGVNPESTKNRPDGDYWKWFRHWDNWKKNMSDEVWEEFDNKMSNKEDFSDMLPKHKWNEDAIK